MYLDFTINDSRAGLPAPHTRWIPAGENNRRGGARADSQMRYNKQMHKELRGRILATSKVLAFCTRPVLH